MKILFISLILLLTGCDPKPQVMLPQEEISNKTELKIQELGIQIKKIDEQKITKKLNPQAASDFRQRLEELIKNYNKTSALINENNKQPDREKIELEYAKTKAIWDYIVLNYPM